MYGTDVWILTGAIEAFRESAPVSPGDLVLRDRGDVLDVGRVINGRSDIEWIAAMDADLLPERSVLDGDRRRTGPAQRVDDAPALFSALRRIEHAGELRGV